MNLTHRQWAFVGAAALGVAAPAPGQARVLITEIMYNPNSIEKNSETEWVEIANVGSATIEIKDWRLDDEDKTDWGKFSCTLPAGGVAVLVNADFVKDEQFRAAWDSPRASAGDPASTAPAYLVIPVKWGNLANAPADDNEILQLLNDKSEVVCEVKQEGGSASWPQVTRPDGPSIYLADLTASSLNDGRLWKKSAASADGARANTKTEVFNGADLGSPGFVPGLSGGPVASRPPNGGKNSPPTSQPTTKPGNTIDY